MKVYKLLYFGPEMEWYFFPYEHEAEDFIRKRRRELLEEGVDPAVIVYSLDPWEAADSREGVCDMLNRLVTAACLNQHG